jgi:hypothetical protein
MARYRHETMMRVEARCVVVDRVDNDQPRRRGFACCDSLAKGFSEK